MRAIIWEMLSKNGDQHCGTVSMTKYNILLHFTGLVDQELRLKTKNFHIQEDPYNPQNFDEIYLKRVDYPSFWPFLDYPTLYPKSMPITLKWSILPYCGIPVHATKLYFFRVDEMTGLLTMVCSAPGWAITSEKIDLNGRLLYFRRTSKNPNKTLHCCCDNRQIFYTRSYGKSVGMECSFW